MIYINLIFLFPFLSFGILDLDLQPYSFLVGCLALLYYGRLTNFFIIFSLPLVGFALAIIIFDVQNLNEIFRAIVIYATPFVVSTAVFFSLKRSGKFSITSKKLVAVPHQKFTNIVLTAVWINFFIGALQVLISKYLFDMLVTARTSLERGVTGLTPEPSMYGLNLISLGLLIYCIDIKEEQKNKYFSVLIFQLIFFSQSTLAICTFLIIYLLYILRKKLQFFIVISLILLIAIFLIANINFTNLNIRFINVIKMFVDNPDNILYADGSISERFYHVFLAFYGFGFPQGFSSFANTIAKAKMVFPTYWWGDPTNKIMSGIGAAFWEIGVFALPFIILPFRLASLALGRFSGFLIGISLILIFIQSVNFGLPIYSVICGYLAYVIDARRRCNLINRPVGAFVVGANLIHHSTK